MRAFIFCQCALCENGWKGACDCILWRTLGDERRIMVSNYTLLTMEEGESVALCMHDAAFDTSLVEVVINRARGRSKGGRWRSVSI